MLERAQIERYRRDGYLVVEDVLTAAELDELRQVTDAMVADARGLAAHTAIYDLEDSHTPDDPRVRRIKTPHLAHAFYDGLVRHPGILSLLEPLIGKAIRFDTGKLNMKAAGYGAPVEWHQDWAFYPHTNDDLCAVGIMLDDCGAANGPLLVIPGSHLGPIHDHHAAGVFCGAVDPDVAGFDTEAAVPLLGRAGSITIHHARILHASAPNRSGKPRRLLLNQYRAADAWPLLSVPDYEAYKDQLIQGDEPPMPRLADVPVRLPLPPAAQQGSIYENQKGFGRSAFADSDAAAGA